MFIYSPLTSTAAPYNLSSVELSIWLKKNQTLSLPWGKCSDGFILHLEEVKLLMMPMRPFKIWPLHTSPISILIPSPSSCNFDKLCLYIHYDLCPSCSHCVECSAINYSKDWLLLFIQVVDQMFTYKGQFPCTCNVIKLFLPTTVSLYHFNFLHSICNHLIVPWLFIHSVYNLIYLVFLQWWE